MDRDTPLSAEMDVLVDQVALADRLREARALPMAERVPGVNY